MKMEDLTKMLRESGDVGMSCLAAIIEDSYRRIKKKLPEGRGDEVSFLHGCLETLLAFGTITGEEQDMLWRDVMTRAYGGTTL